MHKSLRGFRTRRLLPDMPLVVLLIALLLATNVQAMGRKSSKPEGVQAWLQSERIDAINDMAPKIGLDHARVLRTKSTFKTCEHNGEAADFGPWVDGAKSECSELPKSAQAHAWCRSNVRSGWVQYMFAVIERLKAAAKGIVVKCVRHEVMHELLDWYGIGGHPLKVTVTRQVDGKQQTFKPAEIINGRWPSLANVLIPESMENNSEWVDLKCGTEEILMDGAGI